MAPLLDASTLPERLSLAWVLDQKPMSFAIGGSRQFPHLLSRFWILIGIIISVTAAETERSYDELKELHVGALFPMEAGTGGWPGGMACRPAVEMAINDINNNSQILDGYVLKLHHYNSKVCPLKKSALWAVFYLSLELALFKVPKCRQLQQKSRQAFRKACKDRTSPT